MDGGFTYSEIKALQALIAPQKDESDSEDDLPQAGATKLGPGDVGGKIKSSTKVHSGPHAPIKGEGDNIWHPSEAKNTQNTEIYDSRKVPEYEIKFKQAVTTEDIFLSMGFKTPSTASCEWLSIFVKLPQEEREKVELSVESEAIDVRSPRYLLRLPTPHPVDPNASSAKWHTDTSTLEITLKMTRELDAVNF